MSIPLRVSFLRAATYQAVEQANLGEPLAEAVVLICDRCGFRCDPTRERLEFLRRWRGSREGDLCPKCART